MENTQSPENTAIKKSSSSSSSTKKSSSHGTKSKKPPQKLVVVEEDETSGDLLVVDEPAPSPTIQSKLKMPTKVSPAIPSTSSANKKRKKRDSASSDEERWLTAIESGKLEDVDDELKKIKPKDPALMTARQRAMYDRGADGSPSSAPALMSLPTGYKEKVMTAEAIQKAALKSQKRKQLADEKREKDKKKTMERLLKKQDSKAAKAAKFRVSTKSTAPVIVYKQNINETTMSFPIGFDYPVAPVKAYEPPKPVLCVMNCGNFKKYSCSKTGVPLCSFVCYRKNITSKIL